MRADSLRSPNLWLDSVRGNSDTRFVTHWGKSGCTTYSILFSFGKYLHSHAIFQMLVKDSTVSVMSTVLAFARLTYNTPRPTGPPDCLHSRTWCTRYLSVNELAPALCKMSLQVHAAQMRGVRQQRYYSFALVHQRGSQATSVIDDKKKYL